MFALKICPWGVQSIKICKGNHAVDMSKNYKTIFFTWKIGFLGLLGSNGLLVPEIENTAFAESPL